MQNELYTPEEFATAYSLRGYGKKKDALKWLKEQGIKFACESSFEKCYHDLNDRKVIRHNGVKGIAMRKDGVNLSDPEHMRA